MSWINIRGKHKLDQGFSWCACDRYISCVQPLSMVIWRVCVTSSKKPASMCPRSHPTAIQPSWQLTMATAAWWKSCWILYLVGGIQTAQHSKIWRHGWPFICIYYIFTCIYFSIITIFMEGACQRNFTSYGENCSACKNPCDCTWYSSEKTTPSPGLWGNVSHKFITNKQLQMKLEVCSWAKYLH